MEVWELETGRNVNVDLEKYDEQQVEQAGKQTNKSKQNDNRMIKRITRRKAKLMHVSYDTTAFQPTWKVR